MVYQNHLLPGHQRVNMSLIVCVLFALALVPQAQCGVVPPAKEAYPGQDELLGEVSGRVNALYEAWSPALLDHLKSNPQRLPVKDLLQLVSRETVKNLLDQALAQNYPGLPIVWSNATLDRVSNALDLDLGNEDLSALISHSMTVDYLNVSLGEHHNVTWSSATNEAILEDPERKDVISRLILADILNGMRPETSQAWGDDLLDLTLATASHSPEAEVEKVLRAVKMERYISDRLAETDQEYLSLDGLEALQFLLESGSLELPAAEQERALQKHMLTKLVGSVLDQELNRTAVLSDSAVELLLSNATAEDRAEEVVYEDLRKHYFPNISSYDEVSIPSGHSNVIIPHFILMLGFLALAFAIAIFLYVCVDSCYLMCRNMYRVAEQPDEGKEQDVSLTNY